MPLSKNSGQLESLPVLKNRIMGMFTQKKEKSELRFSTRAEAFAYMLAYQLDEKADPMAAAQKANEFADIFAKNMGIPVNITPPPEGIDRYIQMADKIVCYCDQHPKAVDMAVGVATFILGVFTGKKAEQAEDCNAAKPQEPIDFENLD